MQGLKSVGAGGQATPTVPNPFHRGDSGGGPQLQQQSCGQISSNNLAHVHPDIQTSLQEYHERYVRRVAVQQLLEATNLTLKDLPYLTNLVDPVGKNWLCYNQCLGLCQHGRSCVFWRKRGHVSGKDLPTQFFRELIAKITPGLRYA